MKLKTQDSSRLDIADHKMNALDASRACGNAPTRTLRALVAMMSQSNQSVMMIPVSPSTIANTLVLGVFLDLRVLKVGQLNDYGVAEER